MLLPPSVTVHLLHDNTLNEYNRNKFLALAKSYNQIVKFYNVEKICADKIEKIRQMMLRAEQFERFSIGAVYRLLITDILPADVDKILYFDSDMIINLDVKELYDLNNQGKPLAAISEFDIGIKDEVMYWAHKLVTSGMLKYTEYFNSGVLIIDLKYWRENQNLI